MRHIAAAALVLPLLVAGAGALAAQDRHDDKDPMQCSKCSAAYDKAMEYTLANLRSASFPAKMVIGWLLLADGTHEEELQYVIDQAAGWKGRPTPKHGTNWFPALAGIFLAEVYKTRPDEKILKAMEEAVAWFTKYQEKTGGWFKWFEGAVVDMPGYPVRDLGILTATVYGFLWSARTHGIEVDNAMMKRAEECIDGIFGAAGFSYGTGQRGGDTTGARGGLCMEGLIFAGRTQHKIVTTYYKHLPRVIPKMDKGHHIGAFHCLGVVLGCHRLGTPIYKQLTTEWLDRLIEKQGADGSLYVGDDGADGGEKGLLGGNHGSTAAFALLILLQDRDRLPHPKKQAGGKKRGGLFGKERKGKGKKKDKDAAPDAKENTAAAGSGDAWLGIKVKSEGGILSIGEVVKGSPAEKAELRPGDILFAVDGKSFASKLEKFRSLMAALKPDREATLQIMRGGDLRDMLVKPVPRSSAPRGAGGSDEY